MADTARGGGPPGAAEPGDAVEPLAQPPRRWAFWARTGVSLVVLALLLTRLNFGEILPHRVQVSTFVYLALGIAATFLGIVLSSWRWQRVLLVFGLRLRLGTLLSMYLAGQFLGSVLPSTIGGDVLRIKRCGDATGSASKAFASVALERLTGFLVLPAIVGVGFALDPDLLDQKRAWIASTAALATLGALVLILVVAAHPRLAGRFADHDNWMRFIGAVHVGVDQMRRRPALAGGVLSTAFVYQCSTVLAFGLAAKTLGLEVPTAAVIAYVPAVLMIQVLPLSLNGLGIREATLALLLAPFGVSTGRAVALGLLWYAMNLVASLPGAPAFAVGNRARAVRV